MKLFGESLLYLGIALIIVAVLGIVIVISVYVIKSSRLKKKLELEYGPIKK